MSAEKTTLHGLCIYLTAFALLSAAGCAKTEPADAGGAKSTGGKTAGGKTAKGGATAEPAPVKPDLTITSVDLGEEFRKDKAATVAKYQDKTLEVSGELKKMDYTLSKETMLTLDGAKDDIGGVKCLVADSKAPSTYVPGQKLKVHAKINKEAPGLVLVPCTVVEASAITTPTVTAQALAEEFTKGAEAADTKYHDKYLIITGEVADLKAEKLGDTFVELKGDDKLKVWCDFRRKAELIQSLKAGSKVKIQGHFHGADKDKITIRDCFLMGPG